MVSAQSKTLEAIKAAIQMEIDGKTFYLKASLASGNELGRKLFQSLASEEDLHRQKFEQIFKAIQEKKGWPKVDILPHSGELKTLFSIAASKVKVADSELTAIQTAMEMENKTRDFYLEKAAGASFKAEKQFYTVLVGEESTHHALLLDYYEYLNNPAQYFTMKERHSLDGG